MAILGCLLSTRAKAGLLLTALFLLLVSSLPVQANGPADTLQSMAQAVNNGDATAFERLVDVDSILDDCLAIFLREAKKPENASKLPPMITLMISQAPAEGRGAEAIRGLLRQAGLLFVRNGINSGAFAGKKLSTAENNSLLAPLFANASLGKKEIRSMGDPISDGEDWLLPFTVHDYGNDRDYPVIGRFSPVNGDLRMVKLDNAGQLMEMIFEESQAEN